MTRLFGDVKSQWLHEQAARVDPQIAKMQEELAKLREQSERSEAARRDTEQRAQRESARRSLADALSAKGVTGARQRAVIADLEQPTGGEITVNCVSPEEARLKRDAPKIQLAKGSDPLETKRANAKEHAKREKMRFSLVSELVIHNKRIKWIE